MPKATTLRESKLKQQEELEEQIDEFLEAGGKIEKIAREKTTSRRKSGSSGKSNH